LIVVSLVDLKKIIPVIGERVSDHMQDVMEMSPSRPIHWQ